LFNGLDRFFVESLLSFLLRLFPLLLIAIADPDASGVGQILAARNRKRKRAIAKVVCFSVSRSLFGNRAPFCRNRLGRH
jgi:hypothetical protein